VAESSEYTLRLKRQVYLSHGYCCPQDEETARPSIGTASAQLSGMELSALKRDCWIKVLLISAYIALALWCTSCAGGGTRANFSAASLSTNPAPSITSLSPPSAKPGAAGQTLTIIGSDFMSTSTVTFNGVGRAATFVTDTQLTILLSTSDLATTGTYPVVVTNPAPGGGNSNSVNFLVTSANPVPTITSLSPPSSTAGSEAQSLTIIGNNFVSNSTAAFNGVGHLATFVSSTKLTIQMSASDQATVGNYPVVVTNPAPGGGTSNSLNFTVTSINPLPTIISLAPASSLVGSAAQTVTINGTNFVFNSMVNFNGITHTATFVSATQLGILLSASDQSRAGNFTVVVTNPSPGGGSSNPVTFAVTSTNPPPTITGLSPSSATAGSDAQTLTINGTGFVPVSTVSYNGVAHTATLISATRFTIQLGAADQVSAGNYPVMVTNPAPGGGASGVSYFTVNNRLPSIISLSPTAVMAGTAAQTLTINGTDFLSTSTVTYNGAAHTATFMSATQLAVPLSASDQASGGNFSVVVSNPAPGGGASNPSNFTVNNPLPTISSISPASSFAGAAAQTLTINGTNFLSTSTVTYNGVVHAATFVNSGQLTSQLSASDQAATGSYAMVVTNPAPGGGASNSVNFAVNNSVPSITNLSPASATVGTAAQTLTVNGTNFSSTSAVTYNGAAHTATFVNATQLTIQLSAGDQATLGSYAVVVMNSSPGGGASNSVNFAVNNPAPTVTSLSPTSVTAGAAAQTLTVNGTNFLSTSTVAYNGVTHTATFVSATQLTIQLSAADQTTAGTYQLVVANPTPGGGTSNFVNFTVNNAVPATTNLSPPSATPGAAAQTLTINGTNFLATSTVTYNGAGHTATFVSATQLMIQLSAADQVTAGTYAVVVTNPAPGGGPSNYLNFAVNNPVPTITGFSPASATPGAAAQTLTINGTNFLATSTVAYKPRDTSPPL